MAPADTPDRREPHGRERRRYRRVEAPLRCRALGAEPPPGARAAGRAPLMQDISLGGVRIYSDAPVQKGARFELEIYLPDASSFTCKVEVVWVVALPPDAPARHDVGLHFLELQDRDRKKLEDVLGEA